LELGWLPILVETLLKRIGGKKEGLIFWAWIRVGAFIGSRRVKGNKGRKVLKEGLIKLFFFNLGPLIWKRNGVNQMGSNSKIYRKAENKG